MVGRRRRRSGRTGHRRGLKSAAAQGAASRGASASSVAVSSGRPRRSASAMAPSAARFDRHARTSLFFTEIDTPSRSGTKVGQQPRMALRPAFVVLGDRARASSSTARKPSRSRRNPGTTFAVPQHVVGDEQSAGPNESTSRSSIEHVQLACRRPEKSSRTVRHFRQHPRRVADHDADAIGETGPLEVLAGLRAPAPDPSPSSSACRRRQRAGEPDARIADGGADFEDPRRADGSGEHAQQRADFRVHQRKVPLVALRARSPASTASAPRFSPARYRSMASGTIRPIMTTIVMRQTKIIATVGPASDSDAVLDALIAGRRRHLPPQFLTRNPRVARGDIRSHPAAAARAAVTSRSCRISAAPKIRTGRLLDGGRSTSRPANGCDRDRRLPASPVDSRRRSPLWPDRAGPANAAAGRRSRRTARRSRQTAPRSRPRSSTAANIGEHKGINAPGVAACRGASHPRTSTIFRSDCRLAST